MMTRYVYQAEAPSDPLYFCHRCFFPSLSFVRLLYGLNIIFKSGAKKRQKENSNQKGFPLLFKAVQRHMQTVKSNLMQTHVFAVDLHLLNTTQRHTKALFHGYMCFVPISSAIFIEREKRMIPTSKVLPRFC